ncbi:MAG TPA: hypothetical protein DD434_00880 [Bacteroidales bacterium]|nr:hypothetical protein [Bacteroidales bacterium]
MKKFSLLLIFILCIFIKSYGLNNLLINIDTCSVNIIPNDTIIFSNDTVQIQLNISTYPDSCKWTPSTGLNNNLIPNPIATINNSTQYTVEAYYLMDSNLIYNGDFELGNTGFSTQYTNWTSDGFVFGNYTITNNANNVSGGFTPCNNGGNYMVLDGIGTTDYYFFQSTVNIEPNTLYEFSVQSVFLAFSELSSSYYPRLKYYINNQQLGGIDVISNYNCNWHTFKYKWYSGNNTTATVKVVDDNTDGSGNDFAVDNILLKKICKATDNINIIYANFTDTLNFTICENELPFVFLDSFFTQSGTYLYDISTNNNVDSTCKINLNVIETYTDTIHATICEGEIYSENGFNQDSTGIYTHVFQSINGCDSTIILNLFVKQTFDTIIQATICEGDIYTDDGFNQDSTGIYTHVFPSINGCDSTVTLQLIVNKIYIDTIHADIYYGNVYNKYGFNERATGVYTHTFQGVNGCDSILCLDLQVDRILFPNVITPNGDDINDIFEIHNLIEQEAFLDNELIIYNRNGKLIYSFKNIRKKEDFWSPAQTNSPTGTYYYRFIGKRSDKTIDTTGIIEVLK